MRRRRPRKGRKPHPIYDALGPSEVERQRAYRELFRHELDPGVVDGIRSATNGNYVLGTERFEQQVEAALDRRVSPGRAGRPKKGGAA